MRPLELEWSDDFDALKAKILDYVTGNPDALAADFAEITLYEAGALGESPRTTHHIRDEFRSSADRTAHFLASQIFADKKQRDNDRGHYKIGRARLNFLPPKAKPQS